MKIRIAGCTLAALVLSACASTDEPATARVPAHEREYAPTGSNLPRRSQQGPSEVKTVTREEMERNLDRGMIPVPRER